jgi:hypothetical protein
VSVSGVEYGAREVSIAASVRADTAACPLCRWSSTRVHSRHVRRVNDGVIGGRQVVIHLRVRRFFCLNAGCATLTFTEQVADLTEPYRRRSIPVLGLLAQVGLSLAGRAGARLAAAMGVIVHPTTLIRLVRSLPEPEITTSPAVLGVDDFALKRGHQYGTILVDVSTGKTIDLLDGRDAEPLTEWLRAHPGAEVICRDRAGAYADGAAEGAPDATQVADRWHLWHNLSDHVTKAVTRRRSGLQPPAPPAPEEVTTGEDTGASEPTGQAGEPEPVPEARLVIRTRDRYAQIQELVAAGESISAISRALTLDRRTVRRFARASDIEELLVKTVGRSDLLTPYKPYLHQRWNEGVTDAAQLTREITARGYPGSPQTIRRYLQPFRAPDSPSSTVPERSRATSTGSRHSNAKCMAEPDSTSSESASSWEPDDPGDGHSR